MAKWLSVMVVLVVCFIAATPAMAQEGTALLAQEASGLGLSLIHI